MKKNYPANFTFLAIAATLLLLPFHAVAGGFLLFEQGVKGLGNSFAGGAAIAEDPSTIFYNPAGLTRLPGSQLALAGYYIAPEAKFDNKDSTISPVLPVVGGTPLSGGDGGDAGVSALIGNFYYAQEITPKLHAGLGISCAVRIGNGLQSKLGGTLSCRQIRIDHHRYQSIRSLPRQ